MSRILGLAAGTAIVALAGAPAGAAMVVNYGTTGWNSADPSVVVANGPATAVTSERDVKSDRDNTQTFQLAAPIVLDKIWVNYRDLTVGQSFSLQLFSVTDALSTTYPVPPVDGGSNPIYLINESHAVPSGAPDPTAVTPSHYIEFDVDNLALPAGGYALKFDTDEGTTLRFKWLSTGSNSYAQGVYMEDPADADSSTTERNDRAFAIQAVPEPASLGLLIVGAAGLLGRRRRVV